MKRTQDEIIARIEEIKDSDFFGSEVAELLSMLDYAHARPYLFEEVTEDSWVPETEETIRAAARDYLEFAVDKARGHRGLSAERSTDHYRAWIWLLEPDRLEEYEGTGYANYGAPQLKAAAEILGFADRWAELVPDDSPVARMAQGEPCGGSDGASACYSGCG